MTYVPFDEYDTAYVPKEDRNQIGQIRHSLFWFKRPVHRGGERSSWCITAGKGRGMASCGTVSRGTQTQGLVGLTGRCPVILSSRSKVALPQGHETAAFCRRESGCAFEQDQSQRKAFRARARLAPQRITASIKTPTSLRRFLREATGAVLL